MRKLLALTVLAAFCGTAWGARVRVPEPRVGVTDFWVTNGHVRLEITGMPMPTPGEVVLYPSGHPGTAVHPSGLYSIAEQQRAAIAIVYQGNSPELARALGQALEQLELADYFPRDSIVMVLAYTDRVEMRVPWSPLRKLRASVFEARQTSAVVSPAAAVEQVLAALDNFHAPDVKMLLLVGDGCDPSPDGVVPTPTSKLLADVMDERIEDNPGIEVHPIIVGNASCSRAIATTRNIHVARPSLLFERLREQVFGEYMNNWFASFDVTSLELIGDSDLQFEVDGTEPELLRLTFPTPKVEPSWWDSRLRQIGLGALLVGLLALAIRWRFNRRAPT